MPNPAEKMGGRESAAQRCPRCRPFVRAFMNQPSSLVLPAGPLKRGRVTRERVYARTRELAVKAGRPSLQVSQADYEQARCELTGESDMVRQEAVLDASAADASASIAWENEGGHLASPAAK